MTERELNSLRGGNAVAKSLLKILRLFNKYRVPWIVENPKSFYLWPLPELVEAAAEVHGHFRVADFCCFGARWRKRTGFLCGNLDESGTLALSRCCSGTKLCSNTLKPHIVLSGNDSKGIPWTKVAEPYPVRLASNLARIRRSPWPQGV